MARALVTAWTKCWEGDRARVLGGGAREQFARCLYPFADRRIFVNNVACARRVVAEQAEAARARGDFDGWGFVEEGPAARALDFFGITRKDLGRGYVYSICEMAEVPATTTPYFLHFAGDVVLAEPADWVSRGIEILEGDPRVAVVNPLWNGRFWEARAESVEDREDHFVGHGFSDHCYLVRTADFRDRGLLRESHPAGARYPAYGGESFEKRVDAWMRNRDRLRATMKGASYVHVSHAPTRPVGFSVTVERGK